MMDVFTILSFFFAGMLFGFIGGAVLAGIGQSKRDAAAARAFDGGYQHDNDKPPVRTRIWGGGIEDTKH